MELRMDRKMQKYLTEGFFFWNLPAFDKVCPGPDDDLADVDVLVSEPVLLRDGAAEDVLQLVAVLHTAPQGPRVVRGAERKLVAKKRKINYYNILYRVNYSISENNRASAFRNNVKARLSLWIKVRSAVCSDIYIFMFSLRMQGAWQSY